MDDFAAPSLAEDGLPRAVGRRPSLGLAGGVLARTGAPQLLQASWAEIEQRAPNFASYLAPVACQGAECEQPIP